MTRSLLESLNRTYGGDKKKNNEDRHSRVTSKGVCQDITPAQILRYIAGDDFSDQLIEPTINDIDIKEVGYILIRMQEISAETGIENEGLLKKLAFLSEENYQEFLKDFFSIVEIIGNDTFILLEVMDKKDIKQNGQIRFTKLKRKVKKY